LLGDFEYDTIWYAWSDPSTTTIQIGDDFNFLGL